jgi:hypothetical protein
MLRVVAHLEKRGEPVVETRSVEVKRGTPFRDLLSALETLFDLPALRITRCVAQGTVADDASLGSAIETWEQVFFSCFLFGRASG